MTSSKPNHLPKLPPPSAITLGVPVSTQGFVGDTVQSTAEGVMAKRLERREEELTPGQSEHRVWVCKCGVKVPSVG